MDGSDDDGNSSSGSGGDGNGNGSGTEPFKYCTTLKDVNQTVLEALLGGRVETKAALKSCAEHLAYINPRMAQKGALQAAHRNSREEGAALVARAKANVRQLRRSRAFARLDEARQALVVQKMCARVRDDAGKAGGGYKRAGCGARQRERTVASERRRRGVPVEQQLCLVAPVGDYAQVRSAPALASFTGYCVGAPLLYGEDGGLALEEVDRYVANISPGVRRRDYELFVACYRLRPSGIVRPEPVDERTNLRAKYDEEGVQCVVFLPSRKRRAARTPAGGEGGGRTPRAEKRPRLRSADAHANRQAEGEDGSAPRPGCGEPTTTTTTTMQGGFVDAARWEETGRKGLRRGRAGDGFRGGNARPRRLTDETTAGTS